VENPRDELTRRARLDSREKYGLKQADFNQMFAYGQRHLEGAGEMALVYPLHTGFDQALPVFA
jgi:5-methylcytosine-specific restriction enzyme subunit McrC